MKIIVVQGFCPLKLKITQFRDEFRRNLSVLIKRMLIKVVFVMFVLGTFERSKQVRLDSFLRLQLVSVNRYKLIFSKFKRFFVSELEQVTTIDLT